MQIIRPTLADLVRLAYGDVQEPPLPVSVPDLTTGPLVEWGEVEACLHAIGRQDAFDPAAVAREIQPLFHQLMDVRIGRHEDIVIVASLPFWTHQTINWPDPDREGRRLAKPEREALEVAISSAFERAGGGVGSLVDDDLPNGPATIEVSAHWRLPPR